MKKIFFLLFIACMATQQLSATSSKALSHRWEKNCIVPLAIAVIVESIAAATVTDVVIVGGGAVVITFYATTPPPEIPWELPVSPHEVPDVASPGSDPGGNKPWRPKLWDEEKLIVVINLAELGYQGYLKITEATGSAPSIETQLEQLYNGNPDFQQIVDRLQSSINSGKSFTIPIATSQGVRHQIFVPLTAWGLIAFEVYDPIYDGWSRLTSTANGWVWEPTSLSPKLADMLLTTFTPPDKGPGSENWNNGLRIVGRAFGRILAGTATEADYILVHKFKEGLCLGEPGCDSLQQVVVEYFRIVAEEEDIQETGTEESEEVFPLEELIAIVESGDTSNTAPELVSKMKDVKRRAEVLDGNYQSGQIKQSDYERELLALDDEADVLLGMYVEPTEMAVPEPTTTTTTESPELTQAFDQIMQAREKWGEKLGDAYLNETITPEEYDSLLVVVDRKADKLIDDMIRFVSQPDSVVQDAAEELVLRFKQFLEAEIAVPTRIPEEIQGNGNASDTSPELSGLLDEIRDIKAKIEKLKDEYKSGRLARKDYKLALLRLQKEFYQSVKKFRDYVEFNYRLPEDMYNTSGNIDWTEKLIRWVSNRGDMPFLKRTAKFYKESIRKFNDLMRQTFRDPILGE